jgi:hypothetical protein
VHVRRAFAYTLNRTDLIAAYGGYAQPFYTLTPQRRRVFPAGPGTFSDFLSSKNLQVGSWNQAVYAPSAVDNLLAQGEATSNNEWTSNSPFLLQIKPAS